MNVYSPYSWANPDPRLGLRPRYPFSLRRSTEGTPSNYSLLQTPRRTHSLLPPSCYPTYSTPPFSTTIWQKSKTITKEKLILVDSSTKMSDKSNRLKWKVKVTLYVTFSHIRKLEKKWFNRLRWTCFTVKVGQKHLNKSDQTYRQTLKQRHCYKAKTQYF